MKVYEIIGRLVEITASHGNVDVIMVSAQDEEGPAEVSSIESIKINKAIDANGVHHPEDDYIELVGIL